ncbi:MAG: TIGR03936 family radical SAM-associated protein [Christensenellales bacterium]
MILLKFEKNEGFCYISHVDTLRHFQRIFRRASINVEYSQGFNPHMLVYFSAPLPLGLSSVAEYVCVATDLDADEFLNRYNKNCPVGLKGLSAVKVDKNPNLQANVAACRYVFDKKLQKKDTYSVTFEKKGETVTETIDDRIYSMGDYEAILASVTLRPDRFALSCSDNCITEIVKTNQYLKVGEKLVDVDEYYGL